MENYYNYIKLNDGKFRLIKFFFVIYFGICDGFFSGFIYWFAINLINIFYFTIIFFNKFFYFIGYKIIKKENGK